MRSGQVHQATNQLLTAARSFMGKSPMSTQVRAGELHETLDKFHGDLSDRVENMRQRHRDSLKQMQDELRQPAGREQRGSATRPSKHAAHVSSKRGRKSPTIFARPAMPGANSRWNPPGHEPE